MVRRVFSAKQGNHDDDESLQETYIVKCCDACGKYSYHNVNDGDWTCPYCGRKHNKATEQEIDVIQKGVLTDVERMMLNEISRRVSNATWVDDRKEQMSLAIGSAEYLEYLDDLQEQNPFKPDDEMHAELEAYNEDLVTRLYDQANENELVQDERQGDDDWLLLADAASDDPLLPNALSGSDEEQIDAEFE